MTDNNFTPILKDANNYALYVIGLDPIGSNDMLFDWHVFVQNKLLNKTFTNHIEAWDEFNEIMLQPVYGVNIPAQPEPNIV